MRGLTISRPRQVREWTGLLREGYVQAWVSCVGYNAKNAFGGYVGLTHYAYHIKDGVLMTELDGSPRIREGC